MSKFQKISAMEDKTKSELKDYWTPLYGSQYAEAMTEDKKNDGKAKKVEASSLVKE